MRGGVEYLGMAKELHMRLMSSVLDRFLGSLHVAPTLRKRRNRSALLHSIVEAMEPRVLMSGILPAINFQETYATNLSTLVWSNAIWNGYVPMLPVTFNWTNQ